MVPSRPRRPSPPPPLPFQLLPQLIGHLHQPEAVSQRGSILGGSQGTWDGMRGPGRGRWHRAGGNRSGVRTGDGGGVSAPGGGPVRRRPPPGLFLDVPLSMVSPSWPLATGHRMSSAPWWPSLTHGRRGWPSGPSLVRRPPPPAPAWGGGGRIVGPGDDAPPV